MDARLFASFAIGSAGALLLAAGVARAQDAATTPEVVVVETETVPVETTATSPGNAQVEGKIAGQYSDFLGSDAEAVVHSLRNGEDIVLEETVIVEPPPDAPPGTPPTTETVQVTIETPTGKMGYGNVDHTLALAQHQLAQLGISEPTATELQAALSGGELTLADGSVVEVDGVLAMRADGMGWGEIAQQLDTKLGWVKQGRAPLGTEAAASESGAESELAGDAGEDAEASEASAARENTDTAETSGPGHAPKHGDKSGAEATAATASGAGGSRPEHGITTGAGETGGGHARGHEITNAGGESSGAQGRGHGITNAAGESSGAQGPGHGITNAAGESGGHGRGHAITTASGDASGGGHGIVSGAGATAGGGNGYGHGIVDAGGGVAGAGGHGNGQGGDHGGGQGGGHGRGH